jgi:hypothetical protein
MEMAERHEIGHGRLGLWGLLADRAGSLHTPRSPGRPMAATGRRQVGSSTVCPAHVQPKLVHRSKPEIMLSQPIKESRIFPLGARS